MKYMLDANICIYLVKQKPAKVLKHFKAHTVGDIGLSLLPLQNFATAYPREEDGHLRQPQEPDAAPMAAYRGLIS